MYNIKVTRNFKSFLLFCSLTSFVFACAQKEKEPANNQYIVVYKQTSGVLKSSSADIKKISRDLVKAHQLKPAVREFNKVIAGAVFELTEDEAALLANNENVAYVEKDHIVSVKVNQSGATWGLDRLDQVQLPLNNSYSYQLLQNNVHAYIIDTGIRATHTEFESRVGTGVDFVDDDDNPVDCNGHGTHVAGTIGGKTYGVAKNVSLHAVRVLNCYGSGNYSDVIAGIEWVAQNHVKPAVANMSLGGPVSQALDDAVKAAVSAGVTFVVAAGNENESACNSSPSRVTEALSVGSVTKVDVRSDFSNYGTCVDIFAPGSEITSATSTSDTGVATHNGTSMASPHVAGVVARLLAQNPNLNPENVRSLLIAGATKNILANIGAGSPNLLLNTLFLNGGGSDNPLPTPSPTPVTPSPISDELENNKEMTQLKKAKGESYKFKINVPTGVSKLAIEMSGGSGDADLYVQKLSEPTTAKYDCRPYKLGNSESCVFANPVSGVWYVVVRAYSSFNDVKLKANWSLGNPSPCDGCVKVTGSLQRKGDFLYVPKSSYQASRGKHEYYLTGPAGADFDLFLYKKSGSLWIEVETSEGVNSDENISYDGESGEYRLKVLSYSGAGSFELWLKSP